MRLALGRMTVPGSVLKDEVKTVGNGQVAQEIIFTLMESQDLLIRCWIIRLE